MSRVRTKICGLTRAEDAALCAAQGADYLGLVFAPSPRRVELHRAREIRRAAGNTPLVGVFVDEPLVRLLVTVDELGLEFVQLHGREDDAYCAALRERSGARIIRAFSLGRPVGFAQASNVDFLLVDHDKSLPREQREEERPGLWAEATRLAEEGERPLFLAGGLTPQNVAQAVVAVRPFAVDVASGVEKEPGIKDPVRVTTFLKEVRECTARPQ